MYSMGKIRFVLPVVCFCVTLAACNSSTNVDNHAGGGRTYITETWDSAGAPPADWPCKNLPTSCTTSSYNGWLPRNYDCAVASGSGSGLSTAVFHSPPNSFYMKRDAGGYYTCDISKDLPQPYPSKIYMRFYVYFTVNWQNFDNPPSTQEAYHFVFTNTAVAGTGWRLNLMDYGGEPYPYACGMDTSFPNMYFTVEDYHVNGGYATMPYDCFNLFDHLQEWLCVEFMADAANQRYSLWINGDQKVNNASTPITDSSFNKIILSGWSSGLDNWIGDFYIDDIIVADSPIGCGAP